MNYSDNPVRDYDNYITARDLEEQQLRENIQALKSAFSEALRGDLNAPAPFAGFLSWLKGKPVGTVLSEAIYEDDKLARRAIQIIVNAAAGRGTQRDAEQLLNDVTDDWAERWGDAL